MTLSESQADAILIARCAPLMATCGKDGTNMDDTNADTVDPLHFALRQLGYAVGSGRAATDSDWLVAGSKKRDLYI